MIEVFEKEGTSVIDVRENIRNGEHPKNDIFEFVRKTPIGTVIEIHLPFRAEPLIAGLTSFGLKVLVEDLETNHVRLMTVKLNEM